ncbi:hypothetical protein AU192_16400 [Mycobacterium lehmannii]|uniref:Uncharacterized protein n=1 Tax=Mycobacterium lehmannii TaxID=2048550 RepID=A0A101ACY7_9MYCO|nr:hypothetical protein [Mycobacterium lehmannii]KUI20484.1 hypothetical protein AU192_16400 [Mycobacterium lehmannii]
MAIVVGKFWQRKPVKRGVAYSDYALERMRQLELQPWVRAEIMEINANELEEVDSPNPLEGYLVGHPSIMWRRAVRRRDIQSYLGFEAESDDELSDACNYVSVYRWATDDEAIRYELEGDTLLVVSLMTNLELARYIDVSSPE